ncbi:hypothetical protein Hanom_Chr15g01385781 [Helianthus anomalus]
MRALHFELSCVVVAGEPSLPLFCMFYKLVSDGDWFTFAKRKDSVSPPCYSFMPTSTYPKEWKKIFIFVLVAIEDNVPVLSTNEIVQWKRMYENPTRAFTFPEGVLAMGGLSPLYYVRPRAFSGKKMTLWGLLKGDYRDIKFMVGDRFDIEMSRVSEKKALGTGSSLHVEGSVAVEEGGAKGLSDDDGDEDLESRLLRKRKADQASGLKVGIPERRNIRLRLQSSSGQKCFPATKAASEIPPCWYQGLFVKALEGSSKAPIVIPPVPASSRVKDKVPEISVARVNPTFDVSPLRATGTSKPSQSEDLLPRSPLAPLFAEGLPVPYVPKWKITSSTVVGNSETARDFLDHVTVAAELRCWIADVERKLLEEKNAGALLEQRVRAWERERTAWAKEKEELVAELKHQKKLNSVRGRFGHYVYRRYWLITQGFGSFLSAVSQPEEFKGILERIYKAYRDVGYQAGLKDRYTHSSQGLKQKETPLYNSKAKKKLSKLDKEFGFCVGAFPVLDYVMLCSGAANLRILALDVSFLWDLPKHRSWFGVCLQTFVCVSVYSICSLYLQIF